MIDIDIELEDRVEFYEDLINNKGWKILNIEATKIIDGCYKELATRGLDPREADFIRGQIFGIQLLLAHPQSTLDQFKRWQEEQKSNKEVE